MPFDGPMPQGVPGGGLPPGMGAPGGGMPPGMQAPPANLGPHTIPQGNPGNVAGAIQKLNAALKLITEAIPQIPMGSPLHQAMLKVATDMTKKMGDAKSSAEGQIQELMKAIQAQRQGGQMAALNRVAPPPNQPPAMTPPAAPPPPGGSDAMAA